MKNSKEKSAGSVNSRSVEFLYLTSSAGRGHPPAWLSSHKLGRAVALADAKRRISATLEWGTRAQPRNGTPDRREAEARPTGRRALLARSQGRRCARPALEV